MSNTPLDTCNWLVDAILHGYISLFGNQLSTSRNITASRARTLSTLLGVVVNICTTMCETAPWNAHFKMAVPDGT